MFVEDRECYRSSLLLSVSKQVQRGQLSSHRTECHHCPLPWPLLSVAACLRQSWSQQKSTEKNENAYSLIKWYVFFFLISILVAYLIFCVRHITNIDRRYCNSKAFWGFLLCFASYELVSALTNFLIQQLHLYFFNIDNWLFLSLQSNINRRDEKVTLWILTGKHYEPLLPEIIPMRALSSSSWNVVILFANCLVTCWCWFCILQGTMMLHLLASS